MVVEKCESPSESRRAFFIGGRLTAALDVHGTGNLMKKVTFVIFFEELGRALRRSAVDPGSCNKDT